MSVIRMITSKLRLRHRLRQPNEFKRFHTSSILSSSSSSSSSTRETGLYGFQHLKKPKGFQRFTDEAIQQSDALLDYIDKLVDYIAKYSYSSAAASSSSEIIRAMDEIYHTLHTVVGSATMCIHTHPDREFVEEATKAIHRINEYQYHLANNRNLYNATVNAEKDGNLSKEGQRVAQKFRLDCERNGIHLSFDKQEKVIDLHCKIALLYDQFSHNINVDPVSVDVFPASRLPKQLHHLFNPIYRSHKSSSSSSRESEIIKQKGFNIRDSSARASALHSILKFTSDQEVRRMVFVQGCSVAPANLEVLNNLIAARHELAQIMGHKSFAEFEISLCMASSPQVVNSFLIEMSELIRNKAEREFKEIWKFKKKNCGGGDVEPWDESYFMNLMSSSICNVDVASYFPLAQCIEGLKMLTESLFGVIFRSIPLAPGESWHSDVLKISLYDPEDGDLGFLYLDLNSRKGKSDRCGCVTISNGRRVSETEYQLPVIAIMCNFTDPAPMNSSCVKLCHHQVVVLFHEFGHALHSLFSQTDYPSSTRVPLDLAETPSMLFEYFAWDYRILKRFAKHYSSGEVIPEKLVISMQSAKKMFDAMELQKQIFITMVDQTFFGEQPSYTMDTVAVAADINRQCTSGKYVDGTHFHTRNTHLLYCGALYYSYLYGRCFASTIWGKICEEDPLSSTMGSAIRRKFLQLGGSKDPGSLLIDLVGNDAVRNSSNGIIIPNVSSLCKELHLHN